MSAAPAMFVAAGTLGSVTAREMIATWFGVNQWVGADLSQEEEGAVVGRPCEVCGGGHAGQRDRGARAGVRLLHVHSERFIAARVGRERQPGAVGGHLRHMFLAFRDKGLGLRPTFCTYTVNASSPHASAVNASQAPSGVTCTTC